MLPADANGPGGVEVRETRRNEYALVAYSSIRKLVDACGAGQPWVRLTREAVDDICADHGVSVIALDLPLPEGHRYPDIAEREKPYLEPLEADPALGEFVYVPSRPIRAGDRRVLLELQPDHAGRPLLLAYTSPDMLVAGCGPYQPWAAIRAEDLEQVARESGAYGVTFDPILAEESRHIGPVNDWSRH
ncbi:SAV_915 family protein [Amycolatopsis cihanbeyliensis]|uniref:SAV_915 family protein n=1 Tax=Amycolatopsis cihanbeyliensis TaxID=1128664 RepID=UPI00147749EE|nr:SAV_915 family protein [Amycolatopsis cihanbeyliensis]